MEALLIAIFLPKERADTYRDRKYEDLRGKILVKSNVVECGVDMGIASFTSDISPGHDLTWTMGF